MGTEAKQTVRNYNNKGHQWIPKTDCIKGRSSVKAPKVGTKAAKMSIKTHIKEGCTA